MQDITSEDVLEPANGGKPKKLVVMLHGYGFNGAKMIKQARKLAPHLPEAVFVAPDAPEDFPGGKGGRLPDGLPAPDNAKVWFDVKGNHGSIVDEFIRHLHETAETVNRYIDKKLAEYGLGEDDVILMGFSQGAAAAMWTAYSRDKPVRAVVPHSGRLPDVIPSRSKVETTIYHGLDDPLISRQEVERMVTRIKAHGNKVDVHFEANLGHALSTRTLDMAGKQMRRYFDTPRPKPDAKRRKARRNNPQLRL